MDSVSLPPRQGPTGEVERATLAEIEQIIRRTPSTRYRQKIREALNAENFGTAIYWARQVDRQKDFTKMRIDGGAA
jgi:hypothetical protein